MQREVDRGDALNFSPTRRSFSRIGGELFSRGVEVSVSTLWTGFRRGAVSGGSFKSVKPCGYGGGLVQIGMRTLSLFR